MSAACVEPSGCACREAFRDHVGTTSSKLGCRARRPFRRAVEPVCVKHLVSRQQALQLVNLLRHGILPCQLRTGRFVLGLLVDGDSTCRGRIHRPPMHRHTAVREGCGCSLIRLSGEPLLQARKLLRKFRTELHGLQTLDFLLGLRLPTCLNQGGGEMETHFGVFR